MAEPMAHLGARTGDAIVAAAGMTNNPVEQRSQHIGALTRRRQPARS